MFERIELPTSDEESRTHSQNRTQDDAEQERERAMMIAVFCSVHRIRNMIRAKWSLRPTNEMRNTRISGHHEPSLFCFINGHEKARERESHVDCQKLTFAICSPFYPYLVDRLISAHTGPSVHSPAGSSFFISWPATSFFVAQLLLFQFIRIRALNVFVSSRLFVTARCKSTHIFDQLPSQ